MRHAFYSSYALLLIVLVTAVIAVRPSSNSSGQYQSLGKCGQVHFTSGATDTEQSQAVCTECVATRTGWLGSGGCRWCVFTQSCVPWEIVCTAHKIEGMAYKPEITKAAECAQAKAPWLTLIDQAYKGDSHLDAQHCIKWAVNIPLTAGATEVDDDMGRWGCMSALLREGLLKLLDDSDKPLSQVSLRSSPGSRAIPDADLIRQELLVTKSQEDDPEDSLLQQHGEVLSDGLEGESIVGNRSETRSADETGRESDTAEASVAYSVDLPNWLIGYDQVLGLGSDSIGTLCKFVEMKLSKQGERVRCKVSVWGASQFGELMNQQAMKQDIRESINSGPLMSFSPGAGKSGSTFGSTADRRFKVKMGVKAHSKVDEVTKLYNMMNPPSDSSGIPSLQEYLQNHPKSLLNCYYGLLKLSFGSVSSWTLLMQDASYGILDEAKDQKMTVDAYDLKGASRDQTKKSKEGASTKVNGDWTEAGGVFKVSAEACTALLGAETDDTSFLESHNLIDYSLYVVHAQNTKGEINGMCAATGKPFCVQEGDDIYTVSIIDYLNDYNWFKAGESTLHLGKFDNYKAKLDAFAAQSCPLPQS
eukprot:TRINITY_DN25933_c0_g1_i2.p1 TRINITY_DN25933_c0_g1~~TRINITY_DN25933_c0_g1_i2.p1  ORF type:complete len:588 (-),score=102.51 TRINITY_DN25933_c0_g1_i2:7-1770(-)